jgi:hypothetical protein
MTQGGALRQRSGMTPDTGSVIGLATRLDGVTCEEQDHDEDRPIQ